MKSRSLQKRKDKIFLRFYYDFFLSDYFFANKPHAVVTVASAIVATITSAIVVAATVIVVTAIEAISEATTVAAITTSATAAATSSSSIATVVSESAIFIGANVTEIDRIVVVDGSFNRYIFYQLQNVAYCLHALIDVADTLDDTIRTLWAHVREDFQNATSCFLLNEKKKKMGKTS